LTPGSITRVVQSVISYYCHKHKLLLCTNDAAAYRPTWGAENARLEIAGLENERNGLVMESPSSLNSRHTSRR